MWVQNQVLTDRAIVPGATYRLQARYRTSFIFDPSEVAIRMRVRDGDGGNIDITDDLILTEDPSHYARFGHFFFAASETADDEWKQIDATLRIPDDMASMFFELYLWASPGTVWWDDIRLELVE